MNLNGRTSRWAAALALGLTGPNGAGAATVDAAPARTAADAFELIVDAELTPPFFMSSQGGTFKSRAPFCASGRFFEDAEYYWRFTCDDDTGSVTVALRHDATWWIDEGSDRYAGIRGRGSLLGEQLCGETCDLGRPIPWRGILRGVVELGVVDRDSVAPTITFSSAWAAKLPRPTGAYVLRLKVALRDDVTDNPVSYNLRASVGGLELARRVGTATTGSVSLTLRIHPRAGARTVRLQLTAADPDGNVVAVERTLRLPR